MLPEGWVETTLGEIAKISGGSTPSKAEPSFWNGEIYWLTPSEVTAISDSHHYISETRERITEAGLEGSSLQLYPAGTVLMTSRATIGEVVINTEPMTTNQGFCNFVPNKKITNSYLAYWLTNAKPKILTISSGSTFLEISKTSLRALNMWLPPLTEQERIAEVLGSVDAAIEATKEVIKQTKRVKQGLLQTLLTRGIGHTKFKESPLGEIPQSWEVKTLAELCEIKHGFAFPGEFFTNAPNEYLLLTPGNFNIGGGFNNAKPRYFDGEIPSGYILGSGELLVSMTDLSKNGDTLGGAAILPNIDGIKFLHNQRIGRVLFNSGSHIDRDYLYHCLNSNNYRKYILESAAGSTVKHTSPSRILSYPISLPSLEEQKQIAAVLNNIEAKISNERNSLESYSSLKKGLMDDLLTGKVRVSELKVEMANNVIPFTRSATTAPKPASLTPERLHAVIMAEVVYQLLDRADFGSKKRQKVTDLAIRLAGLDIEANLQATRAAAGPYDHASRHAAEEIFHREQWFTWREMPSRQIRYFRGASFGAHRHDFNQLPDDTKESIQRTIDLLKDETPQKAEIIDTAFVAWNDLILSGNREPSNQQIVDEVLGWHPDKSKISNADWVAGIRWIRDKNICPTGTGISTRERQLSLL